MSSKEITGSFSLLPFSVHPVLKKLARSVVPLAYMDDIYLVSDNVERLKEAVLALKDDLEKLNLKVNFNKCRTSRQVPGLDEIAVDKELKVLGVPLSVDADRGPLDKETGYLIEEMAKLEDTQAALLLLRNVHNTTPNNYNMGVLPQLCNFRSEIPIWNTASRLFI